MPREFSRARRVANQLRRELAPLVQQQSSDARLGMVTVTAVAVSRDLRDARVYITSLGGHMRVGELESALNRHGGQLRHHLSKRLRLKAVPRLRFIYDESVQRGARISAIIKSTMEESHGDTADGAT